METRNVLLTNRAVHAEEEAEFYKKRFVEFGSNVETVNPEFDKLLAEEKWTLEPEPWGNYVLVCKSMQKGELIGEGKVRCVKSLVEGLIERNLVQFIVKDQYEDLPTGYGAVGAKLYVVPWDKVPHTRTVELRKFVENTLEEGGRL